MFRFLKTVFTEFGKDKAGQLSAAFAYTAVFSIGSLLLVLVSVIGLIYGQKAAEGQLFGQLSGTVGPDTARSLQGIVAHSSHTGTSVVALVLGIVGTLLGAAALTAQLQNSFDTILNAQADPGAGIKFTIYTKLKNVLVIMLAATVTLASVIATALISGLGKGFWLESLNNILSLVIFIWILFLVYRILPDVIVPRLLALKTAALISVAFLIGKLILGIIIGHNGTASAYGAAGSIIVLLLWFFYTAQILLLGAEGLKVYGESHKITFLPKRYSVKKRKLEVNTKKDLRGRMLEAFARGYKQRTTKR